MRRHIGAVGATLTAVGLIIAASALVADAATPQTAQATAAVRYLYTQVGNDGSVAASFGPGATEDTVISVADSGYDPATLKSPSTGTTTYHYLAGQASLDHDGGRRRQVRPRLDRGGQARRVRRRARSCSKLNTLTASGGSPRAQRRLPQLHAPRDGQRVLAGPRCAR